MTSQRTEKNTPIRRALLSVSNKTGIVEFAQFLAGQGVEILSTGGTALALKQAGVKVKDVSEVTQFPEMMDGRVKTLHPMVHGGILAIRNHPEHQKAMKEHGIAPIDLVVIDLYPFEATIQRTDDEATCIENIDIGGPAMIRAAAKNHDDVTVIVDPRDYDELKQLLTEHKGTTLSYRKEKAAKAFSITARYDAMVANWFFQKQGVEYPEWLTVPATRLQQLRYGENPHQSAALYRSAMHPVGVTSAEQLQGKELSYNNVADTDAALECVLEFSEPAVVIVKHANPCGVATAASLLEAYALALSSDPVSAYGSIIAVNRPVDAAFVNALGKLFVEVLIAPSVTEEAKSQLATRKNLRLLVLNPFPSQKALMPAKVTTITGGFLLQSRDHLGSIPESWKVVTKRAPTAAEMKDLQFAETVCKHVKSNAIVMVKDQATIGIGAGQTNRLDSVRIAAWRAEGTCDRVENAAGSVLASDAFFPFADGLEAAIAHGITAVVQPGGSIRDDEVIEAANRNNIAMVFTGTRHFKH